MKKKKKFTNINILRTNEKVLKKKKKRRKINYKQVLIFVQTSKIDALASNRVKVSEPRYGQKQKLLMYMYYKKLNDIKMRLNDLF